MATTWDDLEASISGTPADVEIVAAEPTLPLTGGTVAPVTASASLQLLVNEYFAVDADLAALKDRFTNLRDRIAEEVHLSSDAVG